MRHVPYKGASASLDDVVSGQVPISFQSMPSAISHGEVRQAQRHWRRHEKRVPSLPDVPTIGETLPGFGETPWYGLFAPAGTPKDDHRSSARETLKALTDKDVEGEARAAGRRAADDLTTEQFAALIAARTCRDGRRSSRNRARRSTEMKYQLITNDESRPTRPRSGAAAFASTDFDLQEDVFDPRKAEVEAALGEVGVNCRATEAVEVYRLGPGFTWTSDFADDLQQGKFGHK